MNELLFLLLPLAFYSGWKASGKNLTFGSTEKRQLPDNFVKGVNYLLNEEPDKALDLFLNRPEIDEYTAETYLLLGNLFRNRGEVDRALSVHQNLIGRASLNRDQKTTTMLALGKDFLAAGMMDRAEQVFTELLQGENKTEDAREALRTIYEQTQEWSKAISVTEASKPQSAGNLSALIANYYCELADASLITGHIQHANEMLNMARESYADSIRIEVIAARIHALQEEYQHSSLLFLSVAQKAPRLLGIIYQPLIESYQQVGKLDQLQDELFDIYIKYSDVKVLEYTLRLAIQTGPSENILQQLPKLMESKQLNIRSICQAVNLYCKLEDSESTKILPLIQSALTNHLSSQPGFQCRHCGYKMHDFLWRCPACNYWDEVTNV